MKLLSERDQLFFLVLKKLKHRKYSSNDLSEELNISKNNLVTIIAELNRIIGSDIILIDKSIIECKLTNLLSYDYCISKVLENSLEYRLLECIFFDETTSYTKLSYELYISESTIRRTIRELNSKFKKIDCEILTRPIRLVGNERNIRMLYFRLFKEKYGLENIPFDKEEKDFIDQFYNIPVPFVHRNKSMQEQLNFRLLSLVALIREKNQHGMVSQRKTSKTIPIILKTFNFLSNFSFLSVKKIPDSISLEFVSKVFSLFTSKEYSKYSDYSKIAENDPNLKSILLFINDMENVVAINIPEEEKLKITRDIYDGIYGYLAFKKKITDVLIVNNEYDNFLEENDSAMAEFITPIKKIYLEHLGLDKEYQFPFTFYKIQMQLNDTFVKEIVEDLVIDILIYVDFDHDYANYIKSRIEFEVGNHVSVQTIKSKEELEKYYPDADLLITNIVSDNYLFKINKVIRISHYYTSIDMNRILNWLRAEKRKTLMSREKI